VTLLMLSTKAKRKDLSNKAQELLMFVK